MLLIILYTIVQFLRKNQSVKIEVDCHLNQYPLFPESNISQIRAEYFRNYLFWHGGIDTARIIAKGYEFTKPIISQNTINRLFKEKKRKELFNCYRINE